MIPGELDRFREAVLADPALQERLRGCSGKVAFVAEAAALAAELGLAVSEADVEEGLRAARREWLERWI